MATAINCREISRFLFDYFIFFVISTHDARTRICRIYCRQASIYQDETLLFNFLQLNVANLKVSCRVIDKFFTRLFLLPSLPTGKDECFRCAHVRLNRYKIDWTRVQRMQSCKNIVVEVTAENSIEKWAVWLRWLSWVFEKFCFVKFQQFSLVIFPRFWWFSTFGLLEFRLLPSIDSVDQAGKVTFTDHLNQNYHLMPSKVNIRPTRTSGGTSPTIVGNTFMWTFPPFLTTVSGRRFQMEFTDHMSIFRWIRRQRITVRSHRQPIQRWSWSIQESILQRPQAEGLPRIWCSAFRTKLKW